MPGMVLKGLNSAFGMNLSYVGQHIVKHTLVAFVARLALSCE